MFFSWKTPLGKWIGNLQHKSKYSQNIYLTEDLYPENVKNHKSEIKQANNLINIQIKELRRVQSVSERETAGWIGVVRKQMRRFPISVVVRGMQLKPQLAALWLIRIAKKQSKKQNKISQSLEQPEFWSTLGEVRKQSLYSGRAPAIVL